MPNRFEFNRLVFRIVTVEMRVEALEKRLDNIKYRELEKQRRCEDG